MKNVTGNIVLIVIATFFFAISVATNIHADNTETQFGESPYGLEIAKMINSCMSMLLDDKLPGIDAEGQFEEMDIYSEEIDFSEKDDVQYPLELSCTVELKKSTHSFAFIKTMPDSTWELKL